MIAEGLYSAQDVHIWLLDFGATFHVNANMEWFSNYSVGASGTFRLGPIPMDENLSTSPLSWTLAITDAYFISETFPI